MKDEELDALEDDNLVDEVAEDIVALLWRPVVLPAKKALSCFLK